MSSDAFVGQAALSAAMGKQRKIALGLTSIFVIGGLLLLAMAVLAPGARAPADLRFLAASIGTLLFGAATYLFALGNYMLVSDPDWLRSVVWIYEIELPGGGDRPNSALKLASVSGRVATLARPTGFSADELAKELAGHCPFAVVGMTEERQKLFQETPRSVSPQSGAAQGLAPSRPRPTTTWAPRVLFALAVALGGFAFWLSRVPFLCSIKDASATSGLLELHGKVGSARAAYTVDRNGRSVPIESIQLQDGPASLEILFDPSTAPTLAEGDGIQVDGAYEEVRQPTEAMRFFASRIVK